MSRAEGTGERAPRKAVVRWLIGAAAALVLVVVAGLVALKILFPPEKLRALVVPRLESAVGRKVELGAVGLRVFPRIAVRLDDLAIANPPGFAEEPALRLEALDLQVRLRPLFSRRIELGEARLVRPEIRYEVGADGVSNLAGLGAATGGDGGSAGAAGAAAGAAGLIVGDLVISDGTLFYIDWRSGHAGRASIDARVSTQRESGGSPALRSRGKIEARSIRARVPGLSRDSIALPDTRIDYEVRIDLPGDSVSLLQLEVKAGDVVLSGSGALRRLRSRPTLDLAVESGDIDIAGLLAGLPVATLAGELEASGRARLSLRAAGRVGGGLRPEIDGTLALEDVSAVYGELGRLLSSGSGTMFVTPDSLSLTSFEGRFLDRPFRLRLTVSQFADPVVSGRVTGDVDLARLAALRDGAHSIEGRASVDFGFNGPLGRPERLSVTGPARLSDVRYESESLAVPARIPSATVRLTGSGVSAENVPIQLGASDLTISLASADLLRFVLSRAASPRPPSIEFSATSSRLDMSELSAKTATLGYSDLVSARLAGRKLDGRDPSDIARERYRLPALPPMDLSGRVRIAEFVNPPTRARDVSFVVVMKAGVLEVKDLEGRVYDGALSGTLSLDFSRARPPYPLRYALKLEGAQAGPFLSRWTRLGSSLTGALDFDIAGTTTLEDGLLPAPNATDAAGRADLRDGRFEDFGLARSLVSDLKLDPGFISGFQQLGGAFEIKRGAFVLEAWRLTSSNLTAEIGGSAALSGALDLHLAIELPPSVLQKAGLISGAGPLADLVSQLAGDGGTIPLAIGIGGTMSRPALKVDTEALNRALQKRLEEQGRNLLRRLIKPPR